MTPGFVASLGFVPGVCQNSGTCHCVFSACWLCKIYGGNCHILVGLVVGIVIKSGEGIEVMKYILLTTPSMPCALFRL